MTPIRNWMRPSPRNNMVVGMGDMLAVSRRDVNLVTYALGSCVGVTVYDPVAKVGGLLHAMLPDSSADDERGKSRPYMFVNLGLIAMFHAVYALGGVKSRLIVKLAGGAEMLQSNKVFNIAQRNVDMVIFMLERNNVRLAAMDTGGQDIRTVHLNVETGEVTLLVVGKGERTI